MKNVLLILVFICSIASQVFADNRVESIIIIKNNVIQPMNINQSETWLQQIINDSEMIIINNGYDFESIDNIGMEGAILYNGNKVFELFPNKITECAMNADLYLNQIVSPINTVFVPMNEILDINFSSRCRMTPEADFMRQVDVYKIANNNFIPSGIYEFCFNLFDLRTGTRFNYQCGILQVVKFLPPMLVQPFDGEEINWGEKPNFRWTEVIPQPITADIIHYKMKLVEWHSGQSLHNALNYNYTLFESDFTYSTEFLWPDIVELPVPGKRYVWGVQALMQSETSPNGYVSATLENNGYSEPFTFSVKNHIPELIFPEDNSILFSNSINFNWLLEYPNGLINLSRLIVYQAPNHQDGYSILPNPSNIVYEYSIFDNYENSHNWMEIESRLINQNLFWTIEYIDKYDNQTRLTKPNLFVVSTESSKAPIPLTPEGVVFDANIIFQWEKSRFASENNLETTYKLYVVEVFDKQSVEEAIRRNQYVVSVENIRSNTFQYFAEVTFPKADGKYAWRLYETIIATGEETPSERPMFFELPKASTRNAVADDMSIENCFSNKRFRVQDKESVDFPVDNLIGDTLKIGSFDMKIIEIDGNYSNATGRGLIYIPLLDRNTDVVFNNIKINRFKEVFSGSAYVVNDISEMPLTNFAALKNGEEENVKSTLKDIFNYLHSDANRKSDNLPMFFNKSQDNFQYRKLMVSNIIINAAPNHSFLDVFTILPISYLNHDVIFMGTIPFNSEGIFGEKTGRFLNANLLAWNSNFSEADMSMNFNDNTKLFFNCEGRYIINLDFNLEIPANRFIAEASQSQYFRANFNDEIYDWFNWISKSYSVDFVKNDTIITKFNELDIYFDNSDVLNVRNGIYPPSNHRPIETAKGIVPISSMNRDSDENAVSNTILDNIRINREKLQAIVFPLGSKPYQTKIKDIIYDFNIHYDAQNNAIKLDWKIKPEIDFYKIIIFKSIADNGVRQVTEIINPIGKEFHWTDSYLNPSIIKYKYAIRIISKSGEMETSDVLEIELR